MGDEKPRTSAVRPEASGGMKARRRRKGEVVNEAGARSRLVAMASPPALSTKAKRPAQLPIGFVVWYVVIVTKQE